METDLIAKATVTINAPTGQVWDAFVNPEVIKQYMFGTQVISDWKKGSSIVWEGEWKGQQYQDKGEILEIIPEKKLQYSHYSPLTGQADKPENYHLVTVDFSEEGDQTVVALSQNNCATEEMKTHSEQNWKAMLEGVKEILEK